MVLQSTGVEGEEDFRLDQRSFWQGWMRMGVRIHSKLPLATPKQILCFGSKWNQVSKGCQSKHLQSRQYGHVVKNLIQNHLPGANNHQTQAQDTQGRWLSFGNRSSNSSNYSSKLLLERILLGNLRSQLVVTITLSLDGPRPGWDTQWSDLGQIPLCWRVTHYPFPSPLSADHLKGAVPAPA